MHPGCRAAACPTKGGHVVAPHVPARIVHYIIVSLNLM